MKARPIIFNGDMVRATIREIEAPGTGKSQTRRLFNLPSGDGWQFEAADGKSFVLGKITSPHPKKGKFGAFMRREIHAGSGKYEHDIVPCPYGQPGDLLYVRETWGRFRGCGTMAYRATNDDNKMGDQERWTPSIHMPRWASRITLEITDVRVERLQDIAEEDAQSEGCYYEGWSPSYSDPDSGGDGCEIFPTGNFAKLWDSIYGTWDANPWVWVIEFRPIMKNVDEVLRGD